MIYKSYCIDETYAIANEFAKKLKKGDIVTLNGDLGTGKTAFTKGVAEALGIKQKVHSPTFTIVNEYSSDDITLYHFDVYKITDIDDMYDIGFDDYLFGGGICIIEWADRIKQMLDNYYDITITRDLSISDDYREIEIREVNNR